MSLDPGQLDLWGRTAAEAAAAGLWADVGRWMVGEAPRPAALGPVRREGARLAPTTPRASTRPTEAPAPAERAWRTDTDPCGCERRTREVPGMPWRLGHRTRRCAAHGGRA